MGPSTAHTSTKENERRKERSRQSWLKKQEIGAAEPIYSIFFFSIIIQFSISSLSGKIGLRSLINSDTKESRKKKKMMMSCSSFSRFRGRTDGSIYVDVEMSSSPTAGNKGAWGGSVNLAPEKFSEDVVEGIKDDLKEVERLYKQQSHEESKTLNNSKYVKELRSRMDCDVSATLKKVKLIKVRLVGLEQANAAGSSVVNELSNKLKDLMDGFNRLREQISGDYRETVERRYNTMTGEKPDDRTVEMLISTGDSEKFLHKAIQKQTRGKILETIWEIQERHDAVKEMERSLEELHQVFLPMVVVLEEQQQQGDQQSQDIKSSDQVKKAKSSLVSDGSKQQPQRTSKKKRIVCRICTCIGAIIFIIVFAFVGLLTIGILYHRPAAPSPVPSPVS